MTVNKQTCRFIYLFLENLQSTLQMEQLINMCCKETLVQSDHPIMILLYILCIMLCVPLFFFLSLVL
jgi:hypothetical protein